MFNTSTTSDFLTTNCSCGVGKPLPNNSHAFDEQKTTSANEKAYQPTSTAVAYSAHLSPSVNSAAHVLQIFAVTTGTAAVVTNGFVLFVMIYYKVATKKTTNVFIMNLSILDLLASIGLAVSTLLRIGGVTSRTCQNVAAKWLLCLVFECGVLVNSPIYAAQTSLVVITIERYFKIVHPIRHRNYFRPWMITAGVVIPWTMGAVIYLIPAWSSTRVINGKCTPFQFSSSQLFKAYAATPFVYLFVFPFVIFVFCYGNIVRVLHHQSQGRVMTERHNTIVELATSLREANVTDDTRDENTRRVGQSQKKIIKTLLITIVIYFVCWLPVTSYQAGVSMQLLPQQTSVTFGFTSLAYLNVLLNPIIYAAHFDVIKRTFDAIREIFDSNR